MIMQVSRYDNYVCDLTIIYAGMHLYPLKYHEYFTITFTKIDSDNGCCCSRLLGYKCQFLLL